MYGIDENTNYEKRNVAKPQGSSWATYKRLPGYVFEYRMRMAVSIVLALFVAVSLGGIIVLSGKVVTYTFESEADAQADLARTRKLDNLTNKMHKFVGGARPRPSIAQPGHYLREKTRTRAMWVVQHHSGASFMVFAI